MMMTMCDCLPCGVRKSEREKGEGISECFTATNSFALGKRTPNPFHYFLSEVIFLLLLEVPWSMVSRRPLVRASPEAFSPQPTGSDRRASHSRVGPSPPLARTKSHEQPQPSGKFVYIVCRTC